MGGPRRSFATVLQPRIFFLHRGPGVIPIEPFQIAVLASVSQNSLQNGIQQPLDRPERVNDRTIAPPRHQNAAPHNFLQQPGGRVVMQIRNRIPPLPLEKHSQDRHRAGKNHGRENQMSPMPDMSSWLLMTAISLAIVVVSIALAKSPAPPPWGGRLPTP